jgi:hypothetical protein
MRLLDSSASTQRWAHAGKGLKTASSTRSFLHRVAHRPDVSTVKARSHVAQEKERGRNGLGLPRAPAVGFCSPEIHARLSIIDGWMALSGPAAAAHREAVRERFHYEQ